ncbi:MAG: alpha/beta hydrolase [Bacteroidales bacterium]|nr:alpha/beta hydrolase [Bacteroidales bacterium]
MKNKLTLMPFFLILFSCSYKISERSGFKATAYDLEYEIKCREDYSKIDKDRWIKPIKLIIDSIENKIITSDSIRLCRDYFAVNDTIRLEYFEYIPNIYNRLIYFFIGNQSSHTSYIEYLTELAIKSKSKIVALNYRGYGNSNGLSSFKTQFSDNQLFYYNYMQNSNDSNIVVIGYSLGSVFASDLAVEENPEKLILLSPFSEVSDLLKHYKKNFTKGIKIVMRPFVRLTANEYLLSISNVSCLRNYSNPLLIMHAKDDQDLPYKMGKRLYNESISLRKNFISIKKGGHSATFQQKNLEIMIQWMNEL